MFFRITVHDSQELDCRTFSLTQTFETPETWQSLTPVEIGQRVQQYVNMTVDAHREAYPRGRNFTIPIVEAAIGNDIDLLTKQQITRQAA